MKKYLFVVDMQNDFIDGVFGTKEAKAIVEPVAEYMRIFNGHVVCSRDTHDTITNTIEERILPKHCIRKTKGWQLNPKINEALQGCKSGSIVDKTVFSVPAVASIKNIDITIVGLCTDICVISTALSFRSIYPYAKIKIISNLCAGTTPAHHEAALKVMKSCLIEII